MQLTRGVAHSSLFVVVVVVCCVVGSNFICFIYPAYRTFQTLEGKFLLPGLPTGVEQLEQTPGDVEEDNAIEVHRYWLGYWVVYGLFRLFEFVGDYTLYWLPYYHPLKILFLLWCAHPSTQGCATVYVYIIRPLFLPNEANIDRLMERISYSTTQTWTEAKGIILKKVAKRIAGEETPNKQEREKQR